MLLIDKYAYLNKLASVHPLEKMIFSLGLLLITLIMRDERLSLITFFCNECFYHCRCKNSAYILFQIIIATWLFLINKPRFYFTFLYIINECTPCPYLVVYLEQLDCLYRERKYVSSTTAVLYSPWQY